MTLRTDRFYLIIIKTNEYLNLNKQLIFSRIPGMVTTVNTLRMVLLTFFLIGFILPVYSLPHVFTAKEIASPPPRIIRTCCSFGSDLKYWGIPVLKTTDISFMNNLGPHHYLGNENEGNGIIYTSHGGFIDIAHLRDQADWTAYLYARALFGRQSGLLTQQLGNEGGDKTLTFCTPVGFDNIELLQLAGKIAYDLSVWHEIATWFGASYIPMIPERYSSFSIEDIYSNLLGITLGIQAILSPMCYEDAMTDLISKELKRLGAVNTEAETRQAMETVNNVWWTREKRLPSRKILLAHELRPYPSLNPWLIPGSNPGNNEEYMLYVPVHSAKGEHLTEFYELKIEINYKFRFHKLFPDRNERFVTQDDFEYLIQCIDQEMNRR